MDAGPSNKRRLNVLVLMVNHRDFGPSYPFFKEVTRNAHEFGHSRDGSIGQPTRR